MNFEHFALRQCSVAWADCRKGRVGSM